MKAETRRLFWMGSSLKDLRGFPEAVKDVMGFALYLAQTGGKHPQAKPLKGYGGAGVLEVVEDHDRSAYRGVYTVKFKDSVYVLHAFKKKSKKGARTKTQDAELIHHRLKAAGEHHSRWQVDERSKPRR